ncbi:MAG: hypothetical protein AAFO58_12890 [Pseudomonadota bacterium]
MIETCRGNAAGAVYLVPGKIIIKMTQKGSRKGKAATKKGGKGRGGKQKAVKKQKKVPQSKKIAKDRRKSAGQIRRTYKNTEEKRNEILFKVLKNYKGKNTLRLDEILMSFSDDEGGDFNPEGVDYQDMAEQLLDHYRGKTFDLSQFVFSSRVFEELLKKMRMNC